MYDAFTGRFIHPDTLVPEPGSSQGYNRYTYVKNNPVNFSDPSGHKECNQVDSKGNCISDVNWKTPRIQVNLKTFVGLDQYNSKYTHEVGFMGCGGTAVSSSIDQAIEILKSAGDTYTNENGIQPNDLANAAENIFPGEVVVNDHTTPSEIYDLLKDHRVATDLLIAKQEDGGYIPSDSGNTLAHFARILGVDLNEKEIYLKNTLPGDEYWKIDFETFSRLTNNPELMAALRPQDSSSLNEVYSWTISVPR